MEYPNTPNLFFYESSHGLCVLRVAFIINNNNDYDTSIEGRFLKRLLVPRRSLFFGRPPFRQSEDPAIQRHLETWRRDRIKNSCLWEVPGDHSIGTLLLHVFIRPWTLGVKAGEDATLGSPRTNRTYAMTPFTCTRTRAVHAPATGPRLVGRPCDIDSKEEDVRPSPSPPVSPSAGESCQTDSQLVLSGPRKI